MELITLFIRTVKTQGTIKFRFRFIDGREVVLFHKSQIKADLKDLSKFHMDGSFRPKVSIYNSDLKPQIDDEISKM